MFSGDQVWNTTLILSCRHNWKVCHNYKVLLSKLHESGPYDVQCRIVNCFLWMNALTCACLCWYRNIIKYIHICASIHRTVLTNIYVVIKVWEWRQYVRVHVTDRTCMYHVNESYTMGGYIVGWMNAWHVDETTDGDLLTERQTPEMVKRWKGSRSNQMFTTRHLLMYIYNHSSSSFKAILFVQRTRLWPLYVIL